MNLSVKDFKSAKLLLLLQLQNKGCALHGTFKKYFFEGRSSIADSGALIYFTK